MGFRSRGGSCQRSAQQFWRRSRGLSGFRSGLYRRTFGPPIGAFVQSAQAFVFFFFARKKFSDAFEAFHRFHLQGVLQEDFHLHYQVLERLLRACFLGQRSHTFGSVSSSARETLVASGNRGGLGRARKNSL